MDNSLQLYPPAFGCPGAGRRHRREDARSRILRYFLGATTGALICALLAFIGVAVAEYHRAAGGAGTVGAPSPGRTAFLFVYVQFMAAGLFIGLAGVLLHRRYISARHGRRYGGPLLCVFVSGLGLALFYLLA